MKPKVSIILPTYNREHFLGKALAAITAQTLEDWELIVSDDGSADATERIVKDFAAVCPQHVDYLWQENAGPGVARRAALKRAQGEYIAFFDSDDQWLPHHLKACVEALERHPGVDWVFGGAELVEAETDAVLAPNTLHGPAMQRPCLQLRCIRDGALNIVKDPNEKVCALQHGSFGGIQASMFRRAVTDAIPYPADRLGDDTAFGMRVTAMGFSAAYFDRVHVRRYVHGDHVSAIAGTDSFEKLRHINESYVIALERLEDLTGLTRKQRNVLDRHLAEARFWQLGYAVFAAHGRYDEALREFRVAMRRKPMDWGMWKTYFVTIAKKVARPHLSR